MGETERRDQMESRALGWQRAFAIVAGICACAVLIATVGFPILGAFGFTGAGDHELHAPWEIWQGLIVATVAALVSAAFAQVEVGSMGAGVLRIIVRRFGGQSVDVEVRDEEREQGGGGS